MTWNVISLHEQNIGGREGHALFSCGDDVYLFGGTGVEAQYADLWKWSVESSECNSLFYADINVHLWLLFTQKRGHFWNAMDKGRQLDQEWHMPSTRIAFMYLAVYPSTMAGLVIYLLAT